MLLGIDVAVPPSDLMARGSWPFFSLVFVDRVPSCESLPDAEEEAETTAADEGATVSPTLAVTSVGGLADEL